MGGRKLRCPEKHPSIRPAGPGGMFGVGQTEPSDTHAGHQGCPSASAAVGVQVGESVSWPSQLGSHNYKASWKHYNYSPFILQVDKQRSGQIGTHPKAAQPIRVELEVDLGSEFPAGCL